MPLQHTHKHTDKTFSYAFIESFTCFQNQDYFFINFHCLHSFMPVLPICFHNQTVKKQPKRLGNNRLYKVVTETPMLALRLLARLLVICNCFYSTVPVWPICFHNQILLPRINNAAINIR